MKLVKMFFKRISNDIKHKELMPLKVLFFVHASILFVLYPYLTIHMRELGINVEETAIMSAVIPVISIIMPPLSGMIADKIGNFKILLAVFSSLGGVAALLLLLVPVGRVTIVYPSTVDVSLSCLASDSGVHKLAISAAQYSCTPLHPYAYDVNMRVENCGVSCNRRNMTDNILRNAVTYIVKIRNVQEETTQVFRYPVQTDDLSLEVQKMYQSSQSTFANIVEPKKKILKVSQNNFFFPMNGIYGLKCQILNEDKFYTCSFGSNDTLSLDHKNFEENVTLFAKVAPRSRLNRTEKTIALSRFHNPGLVSKFKLEKLSEFEKNMNASEMNSTADFKDAQCMDHFSLYEMSVELLYEYNDTMKSNETLRTTETLTNCSTTCIASTKRKDICSNEKELVEIDAILTFWIYLSVRVFIAMVGGTAYAMFEGAVIAILREQEGDYGLQRIYGILGGMISSPLSGLLIDWASKGKGYTDFRPAFYLYAVLKVFSGFLIMTINLDFKSPASNILKDVINVLKNVEIVALFVMSLILGSLWGFLESFLFWFLQDLGGNRSLMGITITIGGIAGIPLLVLSGPIIEKFGHANIIFLGFIFYGARLVGYSLIYNPWMCLIFEAMEGVTSSLAFTAIVTYAARLSTTTTDTSIQGLLGGVYFGVGKGTGSLIGGYLMMVVGTRPTYQILAASSVIAGFIYFIFNKLYLLKRPQVEGNDICKKTTKTRKDVENNKTNIDNEKIKLNGNKLSLYTDNKNGLVNVYAATTIGDDKNGKSINNTQNKKDTSDICGVDNPSFIEDSLPEHKENEFEDVELSRVDDSSKDGAKQTTKKTSIR